MAKFKIGDKVRILDGSKIKNYSGGWCHESMRHHVGEVHVIENVRVRDDGITSYVMEDICFNWDERGLELVEAGKKQKQKRKFKVGDKIVGNKKASARYGYTKEGWIGRVTEVYDSPMFGDDFRAVGLSGEDGDPSFGLEEKYFDLVEETLPQKIVITTDGKRTTAVLYDGKKRVDEASAVCSDDDEFNFMTGAKIALERLSEEKEPERDLHYLLTDGIFGKERTSGLFVVVGDKMIYESGGYDRIGDFDANLECSGSHIDEIYGNAVSFDHIKHGRAVTIWKRKEIK
ncbi:MAG: hypothetical protein IJH64_00750 [Oscillospiraceae bacterium]|nr:hypothetical protein [Oscillospiraceae bacterium]